MLISEPMVRELNEQVMHEFNASHSYLAMACQLEDWHLSSMANWFRAQAEEEREHAMKLLDYVLQVGGRVHLAGLSEPRSSYSSPSEIIETALGQERTVTEQINALMNLAVKENDHATQSFLRWFVDEQVEEMDSIGHLCGLARLAGDNLLQLDESVRALNRGGVEKT